MLISREINKNLKILQLDKYNYKNIEQLSLVELKKQYHIMALNNHPVHWQILNNKKEE